MSAGRKNEKNRINDLYVSPEESQAVFNAIYENSETSGLAIKPQFQYTALLSRNTNKRFIDFYEQYSAANVPVLRSNALTGMHQELFSRDSFLLEPTNENGIQVRTRIFPPKDKNMQLEIEDLFRSGLASFHAVTTILELENSLNDELLAKLLKSFCQIMDVYKKEYAEAETEELRLKALEKANKKLGEFQGALANNLVSLGVSSDFKHAQRAINLVRGYQFKMAYPERHCTVMDDEGIAKALYFSTPVTFSAGAEEDKSSPWYDYESQDWYVKLAEKTNNNADWLNKFFKKNIKTLQAISPVPMTRATPNPANANDTTLATFDQNGTLLQTFEESRTAITEPYEASKSSRSALTIFNHQQLMSEQRIKSLVKHHFKKWGDVYKGQDTLIVIPYLHQTLITDTVRLSGDSAKSSTMLDNKARANAELRSMLERKEIFVNKKNPAQVEIFPKGAIPTNFDKAQYHQVQFDILEVNNCVNAHEKRSRVRNNDINDARKLVQHAANQLEKIPLVAAVDEDQLRIVLAFLRSSDHSFFTPYKSRGDAVKSAVTAIASALRSQTTPLARQFDRLLKSAVELKCTVHETWTGAFRRNLSNAFLKVPYVGRPFKWLLLDLPTAVFKTASIALPWGWVGLVKWARHQGTRRKALYKSAYEGLVAGTLSAIESGCMSNEDRGGEKSALQRAMLVQNDSQNKLLGFNDSVGDKVLFLNTFGNNTQDEHNAAKMTTDASIIKSAEIRNSVLKSGLLSEQETAEELRASKRLDSLRKGKFKEKTGNRFKRTIMTPEKFIESVNKAIDPQHDEDQAKEKELLLSPNSRRSSTAGLIAGHPGFAAKAGSNSVGAASSAVTHPNDGYSHHVARDFLGKRLKGGYQAVSSAVDDSSDKKALTANTTKYGKES